MQIRIVYLAIFLFVATITLGYGIHVITQGYLNYPKFVPDDAFYYLQIAREYADTGLYSFDGGYSTNTGFHLLWFYWLSLCSIFVDGNTQMLSTVALASSWLISFSGVLFIAIRCYQYSWRTLIPIALFLSGYGFINGQISTVEWPLCILISAIIYHIFLSGRAQSNIPTLLILGILGSLARTDFGGVAFALLAAAYLTKYFTKNSTAIYPSWSLFLGASSGFALICLHNIYIDGHWLSTSATMKSLWTQYTPNNPIAPLFQFARSFLYIAPLTGDNKMVLRDQLFSIALYAIPILVIATAMFSWIMRKTWVSMAKQAINELLNKTSHLHLTIASLLIIGGYTLLYAPHTKGIQFWYSAHVYIPLLFLMTTLFVFLVRFNKISALICTTLACCIIVFNISIFASTPETFFNQNSLKDTGLAIKEGHKKGDLVERFGVSDAGIVGYYSEGRAVNLDGLVNSDIANYFPNKLPCYLFDFKLQYANGFGTSELITKAINWQAFSIPFSYQSPSGHTFQIRKMDFEKLDQHYQCSKK